MRSGIYDRIMVIRTIEQSQTLILAALAALLTIVIWVIMDFTTAYSFTYTSAENSTAYSMSKYLDKYFQIQSVHDSGLPFTEYIHQISIDAGNPKNTSALADYKVIQTHMQTIEKSISICDDKKYDHTAS